MKSLSNKIRIYLTGVLIVFLSHSLSAQSFSSNKKTDSVVSEKKEASFAVTDTQMLLPAEAEEILVKDSIIKTKVKLSFSKIVAFNQQLRDQFPSPIAQHAMGIPPDHDYQIPRTEENDDWKFYLCISLVGLLALIRAAYIKEFDDLPAALRNWGPTQQVFRELGTGISFGTVLLNFFSVTVIAFYVYLLLHHFNLLFVTPDWVLIVMVLVAVALLFTLRYLVLKFAAVLLPFHKEITLYNFYELQINRMLGVALFPLTWLMAFSKYPINQYALYSSFLVLLAFLLMRYVKGFNIGIQYFSRNFFHFLLYICALEIAPVLIIIRLIQNLGAIRFSI